VRDGASIRLRATGEAIDDGGVGGRRGTQLGTGLVILVVGSLLAALMVLASGNATGAQAEHCARLQLRSVQREHAVTGHGPRVVVIGDSYSVGLGLRHPEQSWPSRLPGQVHVYGFSGSGFSRHASSCAGSQYAERAADAIAGSPGALVVVEGGLNDYDQPTADLREGFRGLVQVLGGHRVVVVGPPPAPARAAAARRVDAVLAQESARAGVQYVSMIHEQLRYLGDRLHLTPPGHVDFGNVVRAALG
jgi:acyl-CoA thioesterase-1